VAVVILRVNEIHSLSANVRRFALLIGFLLAIVALYWPVPQVLVGLWLDGERTTYTHGFLVAAVSAWLLWRGRTLAGAPDARPISPALLVMTVAALSLLALGWQISYRAGIALATELLLLPILWLAVLAVFGRNAARAVALPLAFMLFAIPLWDALTPLLQSASIFASRMLLRTVGVPAYFEDNRVSIPEGTFQIEGGCSGLHFFLVALAVAVTIGELRKDHWALRLRWLFVAALLAVLLNWLRIFIIILAGHLTQMQTYLVRESHYGFGWCLFTLVLVALFLMERRTPMRPRPDIPAEGPVVQSRPSVAWRVAATASVLFPTLANAISDVRQSPAMAGASVPAVRGWSQVSAEASTWKPQQIGSDAHIHVAYQQPGADLELFSALYADQRVGKKLGGQANRPQGDAEVIERTQASVAGIPFTSLLVHQGDRRAIVWITYRVGGESFPDATAAQLWYSWRTLFGLHSSLSSVLMLRASCGPDCVAARTTLEKFIADTGGRL